MAHSRRILNKHEGLTSAGAVASVAVAVERSADTGGDLTGVEGRGAGGHGRGEDSSDGGELHFEVRVLDW